MSPGIEYLDGHFPGGRIGAARRGDDGHVFTIQMMDVGRQVLRVGRTPGDGRYPPLLMFNGIGGNIEPLAPVALTLPEREVLTFDIPLMER